MKKVLSFVFSMFFTGILIVIFAVSIAYATFIENDYGTLTAKILVYNSRWMELLLLVISINMIGSIFVNNLLSRKKWPVFLFHLAFVVIIAGAAFTRYYGYEGVMHIREGEGSSKIVSTESYIKIKASSENQSVEKSTEVKLSPYTSPRYSETLVLNDQEINVKLINYMPSAKEIVKPDPSGEPVVSFIAIEATGVRSDFNLLSNEVQCAGGVCFGFNSEIETDISFMLIDNSLWMKCNIPVESSDGQTDEIQILPTDTVVPLQTQKIYTASSVRFGIKQFFTKGTVTIQYDPESNTKADALKLQIIADNQSKDLHLFGQQGQIGTERSCQIDDIVVSASYGSREIELPFSLHLTDFQLERYPGSNSPSSFASEVILKDGDLEQPYRIFMNNILKYRGYRFFQSSYDTDEKGTILSVNYDALGTSVTYIGYLLMTLGMVLTLLIRGSRFKALLKVGARLRLKRGKLFLLLLVSTLISINSIAQTKTSLNKEHVKEFGELIVQSRKGRIEPVSTLASEILRKVAKKTSWEGMTPVELFLAMQAEPEKWQNEALVKIGNKELRDQLGVRDGKYASFNDLVKPAELGGYLLNRSVSEAYEKSAKERNKFDKEVINVDERLNILMNVFSGHFLTVFPIPEDENHKWVSLAELHLLKPEEAKTNRQLLGNYLEAVNRNDWGTANSLLANIQQNQQKYGSEVIPSKTKVRLEVLYNRANIFGKLAKIFMFTGLILLFVQLTTLFKPKMKMTGLKKAAFLFILFLFLVETAGLALRWYISGHAPWSNGYESMIFISWATCLGGLLFAKRSEITLSLTSVLAGLTLMVAGMSWMSPEITNLVPVLKSYWLIVHVAIITASYGFLGISALLGFLNLALMLTRNKNNIERVNLTIRELVNIIRIALIVGLFMLTIGSFLGGVWANESWGRYWGWDPKETWALVTILVYTFIGHMHKIPGFKGSFAMSAAALVGFSSVLMTYFGVNYYLSGLHSYAQGEPAPIPTGVYVAVVVVLALVIAAFISSKKMNIDDVSINDDLE